MSSHFCYDGLLSKRQDIKSISKDMKEREPLCSVSRKVNRYTPMENSMGALK